ncbi:MAG: Hpt domain-containing protein, partial [Bacillota bacterium]
MSENELLATFIEEAQENLQIMEESLLELENDPTDKNILDMIFRAMHSIKGSAGLVGLNKISDIAHHLENILEELRQQKREVSQEDFNLLFAGTDIIRNMITTEDFSGKEREDEIADLLHKLEQHRNFESTSDVNGNTNEKQEEPKEHHLYNIEMKFREDIFETGTDPLMLILELQEQGIILASNVKTKKLPEIYDLEPHKFYLSWELYLLSAESQENIEDVFIFVQDENDINIKKLEHKPDNYLELNENILQLLKQQDIITAQEIETLLNEENNISSLLKQKQVTREQETENTQLNSSKKIKQKREQKTSSTVRVESEKLEEILNDIAELLIAQSGVKELNSDYLEQVDRSRKMEILNSYEDVDKIIRRVQEEVMNA